MARSARPRICSRTGGRKVWIDRKKVGPPVEGESNLKAAKDAYLDLHLTVCQAPSPESPEPTVVPVTKKFLRGDGH